MKHYGVARHALSQFRERGAGTYRHLSDAQVADILDWSIHVAVDGVLVIDFHLN